MRTLDIQLVMTMIGVLMADLIYRHPDETTFVQMEQQLREIFNGFLAEPDATTGTAETAEESSND